MGNTKTLNVDEKIHLNINALVEASAGTGKTYSITKLVLQAVFFNKIKIEEILVVTFTEAATKELRSRIRNELRSFEKYVSSGDVKKENELYNKIIEEYNNNTKELSKDIKRTLLDIDQSAIFTIHSFCQRMLTENAFESKIAFGAELLTDTAELVLEIAENYWRKNMVEVTKGEQELFSGIKFEIIHKLTRNFIRYNEVELVNGSEYSLEELKEILSGYNIEGLKKEMLDFYKEYSDILKSPFGTKYYENTVNKLTLKNIEKFSYDKVAGKLTKKAVDNNFELPRAELFDKVDKLEQLASATSVIYEKLFNYTKEELERIKEERHILTFDDLIHKLEKVISDEAGTPANRPLTELIRAKYKIAFVDEFQDTDKIQYKIFKHIFGDSDKHGLFMIGDPKQSIYKFRGADIYSYLQAKNDSEIQYTLQNNFRSEKGMISAVNSLFQFKDKLIDKKIKKLSESGTIDEEKQYLLEIKDNIFACPTEEGAAKIDFPPAKFMDSSNKRILKNCDLGKNLQLWDVNGYSNKFIEKNICQNIADEIIKLMTKEPKPYFENTAGEHKPISFGDFAVLVNTNKQASQMKREFSKSNIPAVIHSSAKIFDSRQAHEIKIWLTAIIKPTEKNIRSLFVTDLLYKNAEEIKEISDIKILELAEQFKLLNQGINEHGIYAAFMHFINIYNVMEFVLKKHDGERVITNYFHIADLLHQNELKSGKNMEKTLAFLELEMQVGDEKDEKQEQLESDKHAVKIMTIHKSKGLQFPIVFCPFIWNTAITKGEKNQQTLLFNEFEEGKNIQKLDLRAYKNTFNENQKKARIDTLAEYVRLLYVALTRAENRSYLIYNRSDAIAKSVFAYIFTSEPKEFVNGLSGGGVHNCLTALKEEIEVNAKYFVENNKNLISFCEKNHIPKPKVYEKQTSNISPGEPQEFSYKESRALTQEWKVGSFSSLILNVPYESDNSKTGKGIFELPGGKVFGTAVHKIFENRFKKGPEIFTNNNLKKTMFEDVLKVESYFRNDDSDISKKRFETAEKMFQSTLNANIKTESEEFKLENIALRDTKPEFSFYYKVNKISPKLLKEIFKDFIVDDKLREFETKLKKLDFSMKKGYLTGEIDLLFRKNNKYFVLDWKTNNLGAEIDNYTPLEIKRNMCKHLYLLQAHIYTLATHLFLKQSLKGYDYDEHFGGFIYIYTRGVGETDNGIYYYKPSCELIEKLEKEICQ